MIKHLKSTFNRGRIAGTGINEDRYDEEAMPSGRRREKEPAFEHNTERAHGEVITYKAGRKEDEKA